MFETAGQSCAIGSALFERIHQPYQHEGQRTGALRFGDTRATALAGALCHVLPAVTGFTNKSLRGLVAGHLDQDYSQSKMSYDLRRMRLHGLIQRLPVDGVVEGFQGSASKNSVTVYSGWSTWPCRPTPSGQW